MNEEYLGDTSWYSLIFHYTYHTTYPYTPFFIHPICKQATPHLIIDCCELRFKKRKDVLNP